MYLLNLNVFEKMKEVANGYQKACPPLSITKDDNNYLQVKNSYKYKMLLYTLGLVYDSGKLIPLPLHILHLCRYAYKDKNLLRLIIIY